MANSSTGCDDSDFNNFNCARTSQTESRSTISSDERDVHSDSTVHAPSPTKRKWMKKCAFGKLESSNYRSPSKSDVIAKCVHNLTCPNSPTKKRKLFKSENNPYGQKPIQLESNFQVSKTMENAINPVNDSETTSPISSPKRNTQRSKTALYQKNYSKMMSDSEPPTDLDHMHHPTSQNLCSHFSHTDSREHSTFCSEENTLVPGSQSPILLKWPEENSTVEHFRPTVVHNKSISAQMPHDRNEPTSNHIENLIIRLSSGISNETIASKSTTNQSAVHKDDGFTRLENKTNACKRDVRAILAISDLDNVPAESNEVVSQICGTGTLEESQNPFEGSTGNSGLHFTTSTQLPLSSHAVGEKSKHMRHSQCKPFEDLQSNCCKPENKLTNILADQHDEVITDNSQSDFVDNSQLVITNNNQQDDNNSESFPSELIATQKPILCTCISTKESSGVNALELSFTSSQLQLISDDDDDNQPIGLCNKEQLSTICRLHLSSHNQDRIGIVSAAQNKISSSSSQTSSTNQSQHALTDDQKLLFSNSEASCSKNSGKHIPSADTVYYTEYISFLQRERIPNSQLDTQQDSLVDDLSQITPDNVEKSSLDPDKLSKVSEVDETNMTHEDHPAICFSITIGDQTTSNPHNDVTSICKTISKPTTSNPHIDATSICDEQCSSGDLLVATPLAEDGSEIISHNCSLVQGQATESNSEGIARMVVSSNVERGIKLIFGSRGGPIEERLTTVPKMKAIACQTEPEIYRPILKIKSEHDIVTIDLCSSSDESNSEKRKGLQVPEESNETSQKHTVESIRKAHAQMKKAKQSSRVKPSCTIQYEGAERISSTDSENDSFTNPNKETALQTTLSAGKMYPDKSLCRVKSKRLSPNDIDQLLLASARSSETESNKSYELIVTSSSVNIKAAEENVRHAICKELTGSTVQSDNFKEKDGNCEKLNDKNKKLLKLRNLEFETRRDSVVGLLDNDHSNEKSDTSLEFEKTSLKKCQHPVEKRLSSKVVASMEATSHRTGAHSNSCDTSRKSGKFIRRQDNVTVPVSKSSPSSSEDEVVEDTDNHNSLSLSKKSSKRLETDASANGTQNPITITGLRTETYEPKEKPVKRNTLYSNAERFAMVHFIEERDGYENVSGRSMWQQMEEENICPGRTWQSMKEHFRKNVKKNIILYAKDDCLKKFQAKFLVPGNKDKSYGNSRLARGRFPYTDVEDCAIIQYLISKRRYQKVGGTKVWIRMEDQKVIRGRTWQSMKERYRKNIVPKLNTFDIPQEMIRILQKHA